MLHEALRRRLAAHKPAVSYLIDWLHHELRQPNLRLESSTVSLFLDSLALLSDTDRNVLFDTWPTRLAELLLSSPSMFAYMSAASKSEDSLALKIPSLLTVFDTLRVRYGHMSVHHVASMVLEMTTPSAHEDGQSVTWSVRTLRKGYFVVQFLFSKF